MPVYEYTCNECGREVELLVRSADAKIACPHCDSTKLTRRFSVFAAHGDSLPSSSACCQDGTCPIGGADNCPSGGCPLS